MKNNFLNLGKALSKAEQKQIFGGVDNGMIDFNDELRCKNQCISDGDCYMGAHM